MVKYLEFQRYPFVPLVHVIHKDPSGQGNLHTFACKRWMNMMDNICIYVIWWERWFSYLCFLGIQENLGAPLFQVFQENPFDLGFQEFRSARLNLQKNIHDCVQELEQIQCISATTYTLTYKTMWHPLFGKFIISKWMRVFYLCILVCLDHLALPFSLQYHQNQRGPYPQYVQIILSHL